MKINLKDIETDSRLKKIKFETLWMPSEMIYFFEEFFADPIVQEINDFVRGVFADCSGQPFDDDSFLKTDEFKQAENKFNKLSSQKKSIMITILFCKLQNSTSK